MKVIFAGTPEFAAQALTAIIAAGHQVSLVLTQPDRPAGRGMALQASPVKQLALQRGIEVFQPATLRDEAAQERLRAETADVMVVAAYGLILPQLVLDLPRFGCLNIHASLLPRWRGAAPIQRAIEAGDAESGVCIMQMEAGLDTGPVLSRVATPLTADETAGSLHDRLAALGAAEIVAVLARLPAPTVVQDSEGVSYAAKISKGEAVIDWRQTAVEINRRIRAFNPFPVATALFAGAGIKLWRAVMTDGVGHPGEVLAVDRKGIVIACGSGALRITELQKSGGKRLAAAAFLAGNSIKAGEYFDAAA
jgi:methionyl-tRNA formyltransferase